MSGIFSKKQIIIKQGLRNCILILLCIFCTQQTFSQGSIKGVVKDSETGKPVVYANVTLNQLKVAVSNDEGMFKFKDLQAGTYILEIKFLGYKDILKEIKLTQNENIDLDILLIPTFYTADEVVITATKTENYIQDIPTRVNIVSARQIESLPVQTTDELLSIVPGVNISRHFGIFSHKSTVTMRGLNGQEQGRVLIMIDGIPVNKSDGGSVNWNMLNTGMIERIEVVKGPGSSLYGGNAMGGAINIISKKPVKDLQGNVSIDYGTYNTIHGQMNLAGSLSENTDKGLYWNVNSFYRQSDGYITQSEAEQLANPYVVESDLQEFGAAAGLGYALDKDNRLELNFLYYDDDRATGEKVFQPEGNNREHDTYHVRAAYKGQKNNLDWNVNLFYLQEDYKRISEWSKDDYTFYKVLSERVDVGLLSSLTYTLKNNVFTGGIDAKQGSVDAKDEYYTSTDVVFNRGKMNTLGLFLQDEMIFLDDRLKVIAGLRFDYAYFFDGGFEIETPSSETTFMLNYQNENIDADAWNALSPKLSVQYKISNNYRLYANYARGFRPSVLDDMCRSGRIRGGFKVANPDLQPEYINNYEIGADARLWEKLRASASVYYSQGNDFMYYTNAGDSIDMGYGSRSIMRASNISEVEIYGAEIEANYQFLRNININANYTYAYSKILDYTPATSNSPDLTGKFLTDVPAHMASVALRWENKIVNAGISAKYMGKRWVNDLNQVDEIVLDDKYPAYTTIDIRLLKELKILYVGLNIQNILDKKFYDNKGAVCPGRFITLQLGKKF